MGWEQEDGSTAAAGPAGSPCDDEPGRNEADRPARLGRFVILDHLGQGGMGVVYSAYDPKLDRRVALKLIRPSRAEQDTNGGRNRLLREAQALARLSHPNIVPVHDVGLIDDRVFVVMELVDGQTLRTWVRREARSWQEILAVYRQAGEGLAAAHRLRVVHRDFKPDNAIVGKDERVRVIDFGLARAFHDGASTVATQDPRSDTEPIPHDPSRSSEREISPPAPTNLHGSIDHASTLPASSNIDGTPELDSPLTATRALVGTPAYMSPEQFRSARVGPATDQFSFCISLYEALYGQHPFAGGNTSDAGGRLDKNPPPSKAGNVPGWVHAVLCRGLEAEPARRYPSMQALLADLSRDSTMARRWKPIAWTLLVLLLVSIYSLPRAFHAPVCQGASEEVARVWNPARRAAIHEAFARTGSAYAQQSLSQVTAALDRYAGEWARGHTSACQAHQRGAQSGDLLDRRMRCLERRLDAMDSAITVLGETSASSLPSMVEVVQRLAPLGYCANAEALMAEVPPPDSPALASEVEALRQRLHRAEALEHGGHYHQALDAAMAIIALAEPLDYPPLLAEALLVHGRILIKLGQGVQAAETLQRAALTASAAKMEAMSVEAIARLVYAEGIQQREDHAAQQDTLVLVPYAESLLARIPESTFAHGLLLNNTGIAYMARGERARAHEYFERALAVKQRDPDGHHIELIYILQNLALVTPDQARRRALMQQALREFDRELGQAHPMALAARLIYSRHVASPARARDILEPVCEAYARYHPALRNKRAECQSLLGALYGEMGSAKRAAVHLGRAAALIAAQTDPADRAVYQLVHGDVLYFQGEHQAALAAFEAARDIYADLDKPWWQRLRAAEAELRIGLARIALGRAREAIGALEAALAVFEDLIDLHRDSVLERALARTRLALAGALTLGARAGSGADGTCGPRVHALLDQAEAWYRAAGQGSEHRLDELARHRRARLSACTLPATPDGPALDERKMDGNREP